MSAVLRFHQAISNHGVHEIDQAYPDAVREYRANIRESWLVQECSRLVKRLNVLHAMQIFEREREWHPAVFRREIARNSRMLKLHREELRKLRSES